MKNYLDGLKFGMILQLAVGPMCLMVFNTAKNVGFIVAITLVLAIALVDAFYIILASLGVSKHVNSDVEIITDLTFKERFIEGIKNIKNKFKSNYKNVKEIDDEE